ncbi:MAG TPA: macro domain-containing protein [Longimicrobiales bacterium]|nr:macro domain-containing protein [Longimicrobiales bacterium]
MIRIRIGRLEEMEVPAYLRPVAADGSPVTPAMRRLDAAAGEAVREQLERGGELPVGSATITPAGDLPASFLISIVVRSQDEPVTEAAVERGLVNGLRRLREWAIDLAATVPLGTGAGNLDAEASARVMIATLRQELSPDSPPRDVIVVVESEYERDVFERALDRDEELPGLIRPDDPAGVE